MCLWTLLVAVGVVLIVTMGMMLFHSPGRINGTSGIDSSSHAVHTPQ
jgi:hypothetical protein